MKKKVLLVLLAMMAMATVMSQNYDFSATAPSGQTLYYSINGDAATVVCPASNYQYWNGYTKPSGDLIIPDTVTYMGVAFPVTSFCYGAFYTCSDLTSVIIPPSITSIADVTFSGCSGLISVTIPSNVTSIGSSAFMGCRNLNSITIPISVTSIGNRAFNGCSGLPSIIIPSGTTSIGYEAFSYCRGLTQIEVPSSVTQIGEQAFSYCSGLSSVIISGSVYRSDIFLGCDNIIYLYYNRNNNIPSLIPHNQLQTLVVGNNITSIPANAFTNTSTLTHVTLGSGVTSIGENAFRFCTSLDTIVAMPAIAPTLGANVFQGTPTDKVVLTTCDANYATTWGTDGFVYGTFDGFSLSLSSNNPDYGSATFLQTVNCNQTAIIQATPAPNCTFTGWSDGNTENPRTITLLLNTTLMANFAHTSATVTLQSVDETMGTVGGGGTFNIGDTTTITATAASGYQFDHWSDNNTNNPRTLTVTQDTSLVAYFVSATSPSVEDSLFNVVANSAMGGGVYPLGSTAIVFALPQVDLKFAGWSDGEIANPRYIVVMSDTTLTALYRAPDTVRVYDTTTVFDTVINIVYDTTRVYDTMFYVNIDTLHHYYYDTTRIFDTMVYVNIDTLHHYYYDTTRIFDTMVYVNIDTLNHYYFDTTMVYDTLIVLDTMRMYDTMVYVNVDTLRHYYYDTTRIFDTMVYVNMDTLNHYFYDTTTVYDTVINIVYDTTKYNHYIYDSIHVYDTLVMYDTTRIFDTMVYVNIDTLYHYYYDTIRVFDTLVISNTMHHYFFDSTMVYDTTSITHYVFDTTRIFDSVWVFDSVYVTDTLFLYFFDTVYIPVPVQGVDGVETVDVKVYTHSTQIIVEGAQGMVVRLYDINGRLLATKVEDTDPIYIYVQTSGTYLVRIGDLPARRVVVIR